MGKMNGIERWEKIPKTINLFVSDRGRILSMAQGSPKIVLGKSSVKGYLRFRVNGKAEFIHRIVANLFLPPPKEGQTQINHINGIKTDNRAVNLVWCTPSENLQHSYEVLGRKGAWSGKKRGCPSEKTRERISIANKNFFRRNPEVVERIRKANIGKFTLGKNPRAIQTVCYETGEVFSCGKEAAIRLGVPVCCISQAIHKGSLVAGKYHFYQIKRNPKTKGENKND